MGVAQQAGGNLPWQRACSRREPQTRFPPSPQGHKYNRRWVEITDESLSYAASPAELQGGGKGALTFELRDLLWARAEDEPSKFTVSAQRLLCIRKL